MAPDCFTAPQRPNSDSPAEWADGMMTAMVAATSDTTPLDLGFVRSQFPALTTDWALMDNAGGSVLPQQTIDACVDYMQRYQVQLGASYALSCEAAAAVERGKRAAASLIDIEPKNAMLGPSTTMNVYLLARALAATWSTGDEIIISELDHEANRGAWKRLAELGIVVREWRIDPKHATLRVEDLEELLGPRTRLVCFTQCANVVGGILDVPGLTERIHAHGARVCVDGVAYAPHRFARPRQWGVDIYLVSLYKIFGPHLGLAYVADDVLELASGQNHDFIGDESGVYKLQPGNVNHELVASMVGTLQYMTNLAQHHGCTALGEREQLEFAYTRIAAHEAALIRPLLEFLANDARVRLIGPADANSHLRVATAAFSLERGAGRERGPEAVVAQIDDQHVAIRHGDFYARRAIERMGLGSRGGIVRASLAHYNEPSEIDRLIRALDASL